MNTNDVKTFPYYACAVLSALRLKLLFLLIPHYADRPEMKISKLDWLIFAGCCMAFSACGNASVWTVNDLLIIVGNKAAELLPGLF